MVTHLMAPSIWIMAAFAALEFSAAWGAAATSAAVAAGNNGTVWQDAALRFMCICGSVMGSVVCVTIMPDRQGTFGSWKAIGLQGVSATFVGMFATPVVIRYFDLTRDADMVMGLSGLVAACSVSSVHLVWPPIAAGLARRSRRLGDYIGGDKTEPPKQ